MCHRVATRTLALAVAVAIACGPMLGPRAAAADIDDPAARAAREIQAARDRASKIAADYATTQFELEALEDRARELTDEQKALQAKVDALRDQVETVAINQYMAGGQAGIPLLTGYRAPIEQLQVDVLVAAATNTSADAMDQFDAARRDLENAQAAVAANRDRLADKQDELQQLQAAVEAEVVRLQAAEQKRLEDERIRKALEAQQAEERRRREAAEQREREEAAARERAAGQAQAAAAADSAAAAVAAAPDPPSSPDGGDAADPPAAPRSAIACPVYGTAYADTWGAARSGGRSHQGVDMIGQRGTPIYAAAAGYFQIKPNRLGGNAGWVNGNDGNRYYYAHMDRYAGDSRTVNAGDTIGYVGDTGNARGTPHLHFEVHPGGGAAVPPYAWVRDAGC